jgi:chromosomal replication initiator protein
LTNLARLNAPAAGTSSPAASHAATSAPARSETPRVNPISEKDLAEHLSVKITADRYARFFAGQAKLRIVDGHVLEVVVPSRQVAELLDRRFAGNLRAVADEVLGRNALVRFVVIAPASNAAVDTGSAAAAQRNLRATEIAAGPAAVPGAANAGAGSAASSTRATPPRSVESASRTPRQLLLKNFIVGHSNRLACNAALQTAETSMSTHLGPLFLHGSCGMGKTHLVQGIAARYRELNPNARVKCTTGEAFTNEFVAAIKSNKVEAFRGVYRRVDLLCIDDVHFVASKEATQAELLHTFDAIGLSGARIVLASDEHPREIERVSKSLISRFLSGLVARIDPPDMKLREELARAFALRRGLMLDDAAARLIAERSGVSAVPGVGGSVRELEGLLTQVEAAHRLLPNLSNGGTIGLATVRTALGINEGDGRTVRAKRPVPMEAILHVVCRELRVDPGEFAGTGRHKRVVLARAVTVQLARELTTLSYPEIARAMRRPNHSTVITAHQRLTGQLEQSPDMDIATVCGPEFAGETLRGLCERLKGECVRVGG